MTTGGTPFFFFGNLYIVVSWNRGTPKSSIQMGFSTINHHFWDDDDDDDDDDDLVGGLEHFLFSH